MAFAVAPVAHEGAEDLEGERIDGPFGVRLPMLEGLDQAVVEHEVDGPLQFVGRGIARAEPQGQIEAAQNRTIVESLQSGAQPVGQPLMLR